MKSIVCAGCEVCTAGFDAATSQPAGWITSGQTALRGFVASFFFSFFFFLPRVSVRGRGSGGRGEE